MDVDEELHGLRQLDAVVLASLGLEPQTPRQPGQKLRHALRLRLVGVRGSLRRLERRGYVEPGWRVGYMGADCQMTDLGKQVAVAAAAVLLASAAGEGGPAWRMWVGMRLGRRLR